MEHSKSVSTFFKFGVYFSHYECLGHTSRVMAVGEVLRARFPKGNLFFIQGGVRQPNLRLDTLGRLYHLPSPFMGRHNFREPVSNTGVDTDTRCKAFRDIITRERPDLFITEFFPLGREECRYELVPSLITANKQGAVLWGVAGYPLLTGLDNDWRGKILKLYQKIIIFSPLIEKEFIAETFTDVRGRQQYNNFFKENEKKIMFAGYLLPEGNIQSELEDRNLPVLSIPKDACQVVVARGGGAYYPKIVAEAIRAGDFLGKEYFLTVIAGPATTAQEWDFFTKLLGKKKIKNVQLFRSVTDYEHLIAESDVCVSPAPYHTSVMLMKHRKKAIIIPFEGYGSMVFREQSARAAMLKETIGAEILRVQELTASSLSLAIKKVASRQKSVSSIPQEWFMGAEILDRALTIATPNFIK